MELNFAQVFGLLSFAIGTYTFLQKDDRNLKISMLFLFGCQSLHFFLMGSATAAAANLLSFVRTLISIKFNRPLLGTLFIAANIAWGIYLYQSPLSILPIIGACMGTYGLFFLHGIKMRISFVIGALSWISHNLIVGSIGGIMLETVVIIANTITIIRLYLSPADNK